MMSRDDALLSRAVELLREGSLPISSCSDRFKQFMKPMIETGAVREERSGAGRRMVVRRPEVLRQYLQREYPDVAKSLAPSSGAFHGAHVSLVRAPLVVRGRLGSAAARPALADSAALDGSRDLASFVAAGGVDEFDGPLVYISYSPVDEELLREFETHLAPLKRDRTIRAWHARFVSAGSDVRATIEQQLDSAQIVVILVSSNYLHDDVLYHQEMLHVLERMRGGLVVVLPVIVRPCMWEADCFSNVQVLPRNERPVSSWAARDDAWVHVARELRELVLEKRDARRVRREARRELKTEPEYESPELRELARHIEDARCRKSEQESRGESVTDVKREIVELRRKYRDGGRLRGGDSLGDGRYQLLAQIGQGGYGSVWRGIDRTLDDYVAIKVLHPDKARGSEQRERFERGARVMATLGHEAVVRVLSEPSEDGGYYYYVMELAEGGDLGKAVIEGRVRPDRVVPIVLQVGDALSAAHAKGLVHRDVKPANIVLTASGAPLLTDFDQVRGEDTTGGTRTGAAIGTYLFMAPEQGNDAKSVDARADVYGLGMTMLFCLHGGNLPSIAVRNPERLISALWVNRMIKMVLRRSIQVDPAARYVDARAFCEVLRAAVTQGDSRRPSRG